MFSLDYGTSLYLYLYVRLWLRSLRTGFDQNNNKYLFWVNIFWAPEIILNSLKDYSYFCKKQCSALLFLQKSVFIKYVSKIGLKILYDLV